METAAHTSQKQRLVILLAGAALYCMISQFARSIYPLFGLVVMIGMAVPFVWGKVTGDWGAMGFTRGTLKSGLLWGIGTGLATSAISLFFLDKITIPGNLPQQLFIGAPFWLLMVSPFQEFFFRGWLQAGVRKLFGDWKGLLISNLIFTLWHYVSPIIDMSPYPLASWGGVLSTFVVGLLYGLAFMRSKNITGPWLAHAVTGINFIIVGAMDFVQAMG